MNTNLIMTASAIAMGFVGIGLTFLPEEVATVTGLLAESKIILQIAGALYFGFAMINWMSKANLIGGIYNRPVAIGNAAHFLIAALALFKFSPKSTVLIVVAIVYSIFAIAFGSILFIHPVKDSKTD
ncbi:MAG TPA: hypothetical protein VGQ59_20455 [Cyclobacteriaceae bacterium]|jgi:hypothetical protein|nr:hypothetical protein [Cyclobacteriaceae bacterium]